MLYQLKKCRDGSHSIYRTTVDITENNGVVSFKFEAENTTFFCPPQRL